MITMPDWYKEEIRLAFERGDAHAVVQLNRSWYEAVKEIVDKSEK